MKERFAKYPFRGNTHGLTMFEVTHVYQLTPPPPELYTVSEYIVAAQTWHDLRFFAYFLHHIEPILNGRVTNFLLREGLDRYDPERFLNYKQNCVLAMLECLESYDPYKGAEFLTYAHHAIGNALIQCRMMEESGSFSSLDEYKRVRGDCVALQRTRIIQGRGCQRVCPKRGLLRGNSGTVSDCGPAQP